MYIKVVILVIVLMAVNIVSSKKSIGSIWNQVGREKVETYECGYDPRE